MSWELRWVSNPEKQSADYRERAAYRRKSIVRLVVALVALAVAIAGPPQLAAAAVFAALWFGTAAVVGFVLAVT